jgi:hypothetical protein
MTVDEDKIAKALSDAETAKRRAALALNTGTGTRAAAEHLKMAMTHRP